MGIDTNSEIISPCNYPTHHNIDSPEATHYIVLSLSIYAIHVSQYTQMHVYHIHIIHTDENVLIDSNQGMLNLHVDTDKGRS